MFSRKANPGCSPAQGEALLLRVMALLLRVMALLSQEGPGPGQCTLLFVLQPIRIMVHSLSETGSPTGDSGDTQASRASRASRGCISVELGELFVFFWMETTRALRNRLDKRLWGKNIIFFFWQQKHPPGPGQMCPGYESSVGCSRRFWNPPMFWKPHRQV